MYVNNDRRNSRAQQLQQQQQQKQQHSLYPNAPAIATFPHGNTYMGFNDPSTKYGSLLKQLESEPNIARETPVLFQTSKMGLQLRTLNQNQTFNVRSCDLERWSLNRSCAMFQESLLTDMISSSKQIQTYNQHGSYEINHRKKYGQRNIIKTDKKCILL